jgi:hypothetical protein
MALHRWFGSAHGWGSLPEYLDGSAFTYVFPDLRGYGSRWDMTGEPTMAEAAADALAPSSSTTWFPHSLDNSTAADLRGVPGVVSHGGLRRACAGNPVPVKVIVGSTTRSCRRR